jgi:succinate dehydrogenase/fumarate reductase cytochrome b subunit
LNNKRRQKWKREKEKHVGVIIPRLANSMHRFRGLFIVFFIGEGALSNPAASAQRATSPCVHPLLS